jgi:CHAT domain-containing protein/tetratricopeptide (TPR) repeat protein
LISPNPLLLATSLALQTPAADSLRLQASRMPDMMLVAEARTRPLLLREALTEAMAQSVRLAAPASREQQLQVAQRLASAYADAWQDSFLLRQVVRFAGWPMERRASKVWADSVRRAGIVAFGRDGPMAAIAIWRRALARAQTTGDSAGMAAVLGNIGAAFLEESRLDSAERYLERSRVVAAAIGDARVEGNAVGSLAGVSEERGDLALARQRYGRALSLRERIGDTRGTAADHNNLGLLAQRVGDLAEARRHFEAALGINQREGRDEVAATNLVNLAGLASVEGDFPRAERMYRDALAVWRAQGSWAEAAVALYGLGQLELRRGDYPAAIGTLREALDIYQETGPLGAALAVRRELAGALAAAGQLQGALDELRRAERIADSARAPVQLRAGIALARADLGVQFNARAEAERFYSRAELLFRRASDPAGEAEARQGRGALLVAREDYAGARALLLAALRGQVASSNQRGAALTRLSLGQVARLRGDTAGARRMLDRAAADLGRLGDPVAAAAALGELAAVEAEAGRVAAAESLYRAGLARLENRVAPAVAWSLHSGLAGVLRSRGTRDDAARELRAAIAEIERPGRTLALAERRSWFFADKWDVYAQLALLERERGRPGAAFEASERLRAQEMLEVLARGRVAPSDTAAELVAREQDLRRRIAELTVALEGASSGIERLRGPDVSRAGVPAREMLLGAQAAYAGLLLEMRERAPRHSTLVSASAPAWREVARRLAPEEAFIEYLVSDSASLALVVTSDSLGVIELGVGRRELARLVELARGTLEPGGPRRADSLWAGPLRRLHQHLIEPIEDAGLLAGRTRLIIAPHAELHYLPFAALLRYPSLAMLTESAARFLIERYEIAQTPSASVWLALGDRPSRPASSGALALAPRPDALPGSSREAGAIARLTSADVLTGATATEDAFRREASRRRVLHLATYGVLNKQNPLFSWVELAPGDVHDGRLEVHEVFGLNLAADLVVLSACQTGLASGMLADVPAGDDWVGLVRAFLHAGAQRVLATLWAVEDWPTAAVMERFYQALAEGAEPAAALARAQRALLAERASAHPFYWAGFVLVGGGR